MIVIKMDYVIFTPDSASDLDLALDPKQISFINHKKYFA